MLRLNQSPPPASVLATWPKPNYIDPITHPTNLGLLCIIAGLVTSFVFLARVWTRKFISRNMGLDDYILIVAMPFVLGLFAGIYLCTNHYGANRHTWDVRRGAIVKQKLVGRFNELLYLLSSGLIRLSVLKFYKRFTKDTISRVFVVAVILTATTVIIGDLLCIIFWAKSCRPFDSYWNSLNPVWMAAHPSSTCSSDGPLLLWATLMSVIQDFITTVIPMVLCWKLQITIGQRVALNAIFAVGFCACFAGTMRLVYVYKAFYESYDRIWYLFYIYAWTLGEISLAIIGASAPALNVLFKHYFSKDDDPSCRVPSQHQALCQLMARSEFGQPWQPATDEAETTYNVNTTITRKKPSLYDLEEFSDANLRFTLSAVQEENLGVYQKSVSTNSSSLSGCTFNS